MSTIGRGRLAWLMLWLAWGCNDGGGGGGGALPPEALPLQQYIDAGSGVGGGPIVGKLTVVVFDDHTAERLEGVTVSLGAVGTRTAVTDERGLAKFDAVTGPQDITVIKAGYDIATVFQVDAREEGIGLLPLGRPSRPLVRGTARDMLPGTVGLTGTVDCDANFKVVDIALEQADAQDTDDAFSLVVEGGRRFTATAFQFFNNQLHRIALAHNQQTLAPNEERTMDLILSDPGSAAILPLVAAVTPPANLGAYDETQSAARMEGVFVTSVYRGAALGPMVALLGTPATGLQYSTLYMAVPQAQGYRSTAQVTGANGVAYAFAVSAQPPQQSPPLRCLELPLQLTPSEGAMGLTTEPTLTWTVVPGVESTQVLLTWTSGGTDRSWWLDIPGGVGVLTLPRLPPGLANLGLLQGGSVKWSVLSLDIDLYDYDDHKKHDFLSRITAASETAERSFTP